MVSPRTRSSSGASRARSSRAGYSATCRCSITSLSADTPIRIAGCSTRSSAAVTPSGELKQAAAYAEHLLRTVSRDLFEQRHRPAAELPQADRRRLEIARALASEPKVLLLDEPSSGMDDADTDALMDDIRAVCAETPDLSLMIIEHDMRLVAALPHRVMVLDYGQKLAEGAFEEVRRIPRVQEAYLGRRGAASHAEG